MVFFNKDEQLENLGNGILDATWAAFPTLARNQIAITWVVYDPPVRVNTGGALTPNAFWDHPVRGFTYRGVERIYPASVVKLFYLVAVNEWLEKGMAQNSKELERALRDMIVDSSNDATSLVVDILTGTTSGQNYQPGLLKPGNTSVILLTAITNHWVGKKWRQLTSVKKLGVSGPYGRERAFVGELLENRNMLTTNAIARLLHSIVGGVAVSSARSQAMMALLKRPLKDLPTDTEENQVTGFLGAGLTENAQIWSKAGWTSQVRHDAAYIELPEQRPYLLVVFTEGKAQAKSQAILPFVSKLVADAISSL